MDIRGKTRERLLRAMLAVAFIVCLSALLLAAASRVARAQTGSAASSKGFAEMSVRQRGRVRAPELAGGRGWLNTERPLTIAGLRGKVVLLDFWTYGCINCMHVIPDLQRLEAKYARQLVVVGVHSAKFENEKETENIRRVILRYGVEHPVVNDADFRIWDAYAVDAWPTQVLIDPAGYVVGKVAGEGHYEALDRVIGELIVEARTRGELNEEPLKLALERAKTGDLPLAFPGKILADARGDRLFIADSNHHRIVITRLDGTLIETVGTGAQGARDGRFDEATFYRPQGLALDEAADALYVADTANHLIRRIDLKARTVQTIAGTGQQMRDFGTRGGAARTTSIASPWDLQLVGRTLYIAMAGPHQIWQLDLERQQLSVFAGTGREARLDGPRDEAAFAQPSGLATDGRALYVADSESNIIRAIELPDAKQTPARSDAQAASPSTDSSASGVEVPQPQVSTLVGGDLFEFGDRDGRGDDVRLQHPLGLASAEDGALLIADTYNHKIKRLDTRTRTVSTFLGTGKPGQSDGATPSFYEPGGLSLARGKLYVADTNNHAVRVIDLQTKQTSTLRLAGLRPPPPASDALATNVEDEAAPNVKEIRLAPQRFVAGERGQLTVDVTLPAGYHLNPSAPQRYRIWVAMGGEELSHAGKIDGHGNGVALSAKVTGDPKLPLRVPLGSFSPGALDLRVRLTLFYCREDNTGTCRVKTLVWRAPLEVINDREAPREVRAHAKID
ncbi:MAG TPA: thioredoxin-like domain-containing protein [Pyrinomonadaceae bacterium]|nr:thioredoxin-like domain-containing protein [Pyrinomonadaceae bacterium]